MAWSLNRAQIIGNVTRDPELRVTPNGQSVASFGVATNRRWKDQNGNQQESTEFHEVVAWGRLAELIQQILHKGNRVYVEGRLQTRTWEGPDGGRRSRTEIVMENFVPLTPRAGTEPTVAAATELLGGATPQEDQISLKGTKTKKGKKGAKEDQTSPPDKAVDEINLDDIPF
jgi:single-strand DNA-binding protein